MIPVTRRLAFAAVACCGLWFSAIAPSVAGVITFQDTAVGTTITNQYAAGQGVAFSSGVVDQDYLGGYFLRVSDPVHPAMDLIFGSPIYRFQARVYETTTEFSPPPQPNPPDLPPPSDTAPPADAPPANDAKPDAQQSIYPTIYATDGDAVSLEVIHALGVWKDLSFESTEPIDRLSLLGHYLSGDTPVYFFIDDVSVDTTPIIPVPIPSSLTLALVGLAGVASIRRRV